MSKLLATFFGLGYAPKAPGTVGALGACLLFAGFQWLGMEAWLFFALLTILFFMGVFASFEVEKAWGKDDNRVVVDEAFGMGISLVLVPFQLEYYVLAFAFFRLFDIWKPFGIRYLERLEGGWGVMADDFLAGIYANLVLHLIIYLRMTS